MTTTADATTAAAGAIGVKSGQVIAGEIGSGSFGYTTIGEQVGMAQRMESVAPPGGVMLSASMARRCCSNRPTKSSRRVTVSGMGGMDVYVSEDDVRRYVAETLPRDKRSDWDIDAISRDVVAEWPDLVGEHPDLADMPGPDYAADWLDRVIQPESRYWGIVARHQVFRSAE